ncbi:glycosyltransferase family 2 protein [Rhizomonospora bruguierae]|uniref:glycosyltransferase family 2 protein n=1 Tax=Rhizomonospora bruguierae TaxID=1581705 RepID=UPI001BCE993E|nr:glycosyltransferase family 2 protein [Micromonospora sp. NBRC 107566]
MSGRVAPRPLATRPTVSVVVPCYNYGHYLPECVASVLDQDAVEVDVLVIDDASPDGSARVAHDLAAADPRVRVIAHQANRGHIATYNEGLALAKGEYVVLLSADDLLTPGSLARATALMEHHPEVGLVYGFSPVFGASRPRLRTRVRSWSVWPGERWLELICRRGRNPVATPEVVLRTGLMTELVGYDARMPHAADFFLWLRAAARAGVGRVNGADQALYRVHGENMHTSERFAGALKDIAERRRTFETFFAEDGVALPAVGRLSAMAGAALDAQERATRRELARGGRAGVAGDVSRAAGALMDKVRWRQFRRDGIFGRGWSM